MSHSSRSWHHPCVGRRSVRKTTPAKLSHPTSISSSEKEVSHGHEESEEEEDVEVTSPARASYWGAHSLRTSRGTWRYDSGRTQSRPLLFTLDTILYSTSLSNRCFCAHTSQFGWSGAGADVIRTSFNCLPAFCGSTFDLSVRRGVKTSRPGFFRTRARTDGTRREG
jgi:hypothetical protein